MMMGPRCPRNEGRRPIQSCGSRFVDHIARSSPRSVRSVRPSVRYRVGARVAAAQSRVKSVGRLVWWAVQVEVTVRSSAVDSCGYGLSCIKHPLLVTCCNSTDHEMRRRILLTYGGPSPKRTIRASKKVKWGKQKKAVR